MEPNKTTTKRLQREWHFPLCTKEVELRGRIYRIGIHCIENVRGLTAVAEIRSTDLDGGDPDQLVFSRVASAIRYFDDLADLAERIKERRN